MPEQIRNNSELQNLEFQSFEIYAAFRWMSALESFMEQFEKNIPLSTQSLRVFTPLERLRLDSECRGYLLFLEQAHILTPQTREVVIERALAIDTEELTLERLKWLVLIVLMRERNQNEPMSWMEDFILSDTNKHRFH
jgi:Smg protein